MRICRWSGATSAECELLVRSGSPSVWQCDDRQQVFSWSAVRREDRPGRRGGQSAAGSCQDQWAWSAEGELQRMMGARTELTHDQQGILNTETRLKTFNAVASLWNVIAHIRRRVTFPSSDYKPDILKVPELLCFMKCLDPSQPIEEYFIISSVFISSCAVTQQVSQVLYYQYQSAICFLDESIICLVFKLYENIEKILSIFHTSLFKSLIPQIWMTKKSSRLVHMKNKLTGCSLETLKDNISLNLVNN